MVKNSKRAKHQPIREGDRFERLLVVFTAMPAPGGQKRWSCMCDCGVARVVRDAELKRGNSRSCGCLQREMNSVATAKRNMTHGKSGSRAYVIWQHMHARCTDVSNADFKNYGARGITVCDRWSDFASFLADMGEPAPGQTLDREKNEIGYGPGNCRWVSRAVQNRNKRNNVWVTVGAERLCFADACRAVGVDKTTAYSLMKDRGISHQEAIEVYAAKNSVHSLTLVTHLALPTGAVSESSIVTNGSHLFLFSSHSGLKKISPDEAVEMVEEGKRNAAAVEAKAAAAAQRARDNAAVCARLLDLAA